MSPPVSANGYGNGNGASAYGTPGTDAGYAGPPSGAMTEASPYEPAPGYERGAPYQPAPAYDGAPAGYGSTSDYASVPAYGSGTGYDPAPASGGVPWAGQGGAPGRGATWSPYDGDPPPPDGWSPYVDAPPVAAPPYQPSSYEVPSYEDPASGYGRAAVANGTAVNGGRAATYPASPPSGPVDGQAGVLRGAPHESMARAGAAAPGRMAWLNEADVPSEAEEATGTGAAQRGDTRYGTPGSPLGSTTPPTGAVIPRHATGSIPMDPMDMPPDEIGSGPARRLNGALREEDGARTSGLRRLAPERHPDAGWAGSGPNGVAPTIGVPRPSWSEGAGETGEEPLFGAGSSGRIRVGGARSAPPLRRLGSPGGPALNGSSGGWNGAGGGSDGRDDRMGIDPRRGDEGHPEKRQGPVGAAFSAVSEVVVVVVLALVLALVIKTFLVQAFFIPSESMENTLLTGDRVLVSKLSPGVFGLHRGDVVVFKDPGGWLTPTTPPDEGPLRNSVRSVLTFVGLLPQDSGEHLIKRVIGMPGDRVTCCDAQGRIQVNGVSIDEPYVYPGNVPSEKPFNETVPPGMLWVLGDHRSVSEDSRFHPDLNRGMVPMTDVVGKAFVIVWPLSRATTLGIPDTVFARVPDPPPAGP